MMAGDRLGRVHVLAIVLSIAVLAIGAGGQAGPSADGPIEGAQDGLGSDPQVIEPVPNGSKLWPYTSKTRSVEGRTLGINIIVIGDPSAVQSYFRRHAEGNWSRRPHPAEPRDGGEDLLPIEDAGPAWQEGYASTRYTLIVPAGSEVVGGADEGATEQDENEQAREGIWVAEAYELFDGPYLGTRYHVRAYVPPDDATWTALQAHHEYWDWFRLRHTVTSVATARDYVEADLGANAPIQAKSIRQVGPPGPLDGSGWLTLVEFLAILGLLGSLRLSGSSPGSLRARTRDFLSNVRGENPWASVAVVGGLALVYMGVRLGAIELESVLPGVTPKIIVAMLYPVLAIGLPLLADRFARPLRPQVAFLLAATGLAMAFALDFAYLDLAVIPLGLLGHRVSLALSIGLVGAGSALASDGERWNVVRVLGIGGWVLGLLVGIVGIA